MELFEQDITDFQFSRAGGMTVKTWLGIELSQRGIDVNLKLPPAFSFNVYGVCGNFNCDPGPIG